MLLSDVTIHYLLFTNKITLLTLCVWRTIRNGYHKKKLKKQKNIEFSIFEFFVDSAIYMHR
jgi:hypothetical protein